MPSEILSCHWAIALGSSSGHALSGSRRLRKRRCDPDTGYQTTGKCWRWEAIAGCPSVIGKARSVICQTCVSECPLGLARHWSRRRDGPTLDDNTVLTGFSRCYLRRPGFASSHQVADVRRPLLPGSWRHRTGCMRMNADLFVYNAQTTNRQIPFPRFSTRLIRAKVAVGVAQGMVGPVASSCQTCVVRTCRSWSLMPLNNGGVYKNATAACNSQEVTSPLLLVT
jgi:ferredoxin